jgi:hypothetical protein
MSFAGEGLYQPLPAVCWRPDRRRLGSPKPAAGGLAALLE